MSMRVRSVNQARLDRAEPHEYASERTGASIIDLGHRRGTASEMADAWVANGVGPHEKAVLIGLAATQGHNLKYIAERTALHVESVVRAFDDLVEAGLVLLPPDPVLRPRPTPRVHISQSARKRVFERDAYRCVHCGGWKDLELDHVVALANGGSNDEENLQTLCKQCNTRKGAS